MLGTIMAWLFGTAMGRGVLLGGSLSIGLALGWWMFSSHYDGVGYARCQSEQEKARADANAKQAADNATNNQTSSEVGRDTVDNVNTVINESDTQTSDAKETIRYVYRDAPRTAPVALGSCVHPVDDRVQERIDDAVRRASRAP